MYAMDAESELKKRVLEFVRNAFRVENQVPTIRKIAEGIEGVDRSNIYDLFPQGIKQISKEAGVDIPRKRINVTAKASKARKSKGEDPFPDIILRDQLAQELWVISTYEGNKPQELIEELIDQSKVLKTQFGLSNKDVANFTMFLKNCEKEGLGEEQIVNSIKKFTRLSLEVLWPHRFDVLIRLVETMASKHLKIEDLYKIYISQIEMYQAGYMLCLGYAEEEFILELQKILSMKPLDALNAANEIKIKLAFRFPYRF